MMVKTHPTLNKYRVIGFDKIEHLREYFVNKYNVQRRFIMELGEGTHCKRQWFDIKFVCINDEQKSQINKICWKKGGELK